MQVRDRNTQGPDLPKLDSWSRIPVSYLLVSIKDPHETETSRLGGSYIYKRIRGDLTFAPRPAETSRAGLSRVTIQEAPTWFEVHAGFWIHGDFRRPI